MVGLIPTELHRYSLADVRRGLAAGRRAVRADETVPLPALGDGIPVRSARAAVIVALQALGLPPGSRVGVPLYCCPVVFKAIHAAGCVPSFLDIEPETFALSLKDLGGKSSELKALIAVHMFGNLCEMPRIVEIMAGRPVLEDCAQSLGSGIEGRASGSFGDVAFFSFRSGKYLSVGEGGALWVRDPELRARVSGLVQALPAPSPAREMRHVLETYVRSKLRGRIGWGLLGSRIWSIYNRRTEYADRSPIVMTRMFASDMATLRKRLPELDSLIASQRAHAEYFERNLRLTPGMAFPERPGTFSNRFMYPLVFPSTEARDHVAAELARRGVGTSKPYQETVVGARLHYGYRGDCPQAERLLRTTLVIPSFSSLDQKEIERIAREVNEALAGALSTRS